MMYRPYTLTLKLSIFLWWRTKLDVNHTRWKKTMKWKTENYEMMWDYVWINSTNEVVFIFLFLLYLLHLDSFSYPSYKPQCIGLSIGLGLLIPIQPCPISSQLSLVFLFYFLFVSTCTNFSSAPSDPSRPIWPSLHLILSVFSVLFNSPHFFYLHYFLC